MTRQHRKIHRLKRQQAPSVRHQADIDASPEGRSLPENVTLDCGWGDLIIAHTFRTAREVARALAQETHGRRDIAFYVRDPHVLLAQAPQNLFLDPSHTFRLWLSSYKPDGHRRHGFGVRLLRTRADAAGINKVYETRQMVPVDPCFIWKQRTSRKLTYIVASAPRPRRRRAGGSVDPPPDTTGWNLFRDRQRR